MDFYLLAHIALTVAFLCSLGAALLIWVDGLRDTRDRARESEALAAANKEVSRRPRMPAITTPLPTLNKGTSK